MLVGGRLRVFGSSAGALALCVAFGGCRDHTSGANPDALHVNERTGLVRGVGIGSSKAQVAARFGSYGRHPRAYPPEPLGTGDEGAGDPYYARSGPYHLGPGGLPERVQVTLRYRGVSFFTLYGRVFGFMVTKPEATTARGVSIGDHLGDAREKYPELKCEGASEGETGVADAAECSGRVGPRRFIWFGGDANGLSALCGILGGCSKPFSGNERIQSITVQKWDIFKGPLAH